MSNNLDANYNKWRIKLRLIPLSCLLVFLTYQAIAFFLIITTLSFKITDIWICLFVVIGAVYSIVYFYIFLLFKVWLKKYWMKKPVFIVNERGITDKVNYKSVGFIPWSNIRRITAFASKEHYLVFSIENSTEILEKFKGTSRQKKLAKQFKKEGLHIKIATKWLDVNVNQLKKVAQANLVTYQKQNEKLSIAS